jgi:hypothetical protein
MNSPVPRVSEFSRSRQTAGALASLALGFCGSLATADADAVIGLNFCDAWPAPHVAAAPADGCAAWTDTRAVWDWTDPAVQIEPLPLGDSGVTVTWQASNTWAAGSENDNDQALYRVYLDDGETSPGTGVRVTITGLGAWLARHGHAAYQLRCYSNNDGAATFRPISLRYGAAADGPVLHTMTPAACGDGDFPTTVTPPAGQARGFADSPATLTADTLTLTLLPRDGSTRGTLCAFKITGSGTAATPHALTRERWNNLGGWLVSDLTANRPRFLGPPDEILTTPGDPAAPAIDEANLGDYYATRHRGFLTAPVTGWYRFWITADDEAELWLADGSVKKIIAGHTYPFFNRFGKRRLAFIQDSRYGTTWTNPGDFDRFPTQGSAAVHLTAGQTCYLEILHKDADGPDHLALAWQVPGQARTLVPAAALTSDTIPFDEADPTYDDIDNDNLPAAWETQFGLDPADNGLLDPRDGQSGDLDGDGLDNLTEFQLSTRPDLSDTDGDTLSDKDERYYYHTDPHVPNLLQPGPLATVPLASFTATSVPWNLRDDGSAVAYDRRGWTDFPITVAAGEEGVYEITLTGGAEGGAVRSTEKLPLSFKLDAALIGRRTLICLTGQNSTLKQLTPWLKAGTYTLRVENHNVRAGCNLRINSLTYQRLGGPDGNANAIPDWLETKLATENRLTRIPLESPTSPACIEGVTTSFNTLEILAEQGGTGGPPVLQPQTILQGPDNLFYSNIPLDPTGGATPFTLTYQNGLMTDPRAITWTVTDLSTTDTIHLRQGDSLRLDASKTGTGPGQNFGTYSVTLDGTLLPTATGGPNHHPGQPFTATFSTPGVHPLLVTYHGNKPARTVTVHVHAADFGPDFAIQTWNRRTWTLPGVNGMDIEAGCNLTWVETTAPGSSNRSFTVDVYETGTRYVIARLPQTGDIIARGTINAFMVGTAVETADMQYMEYLPGGAIRFRFTLVAEGLPPNAEIRLTTYFQGAIFGDGSRTLTLLPADFDRNGIANVFIELGPEMDPKTCHTLEVFLTNPR